MTQSNKRKNAKNSSHHASTPTSAPKKAGVLRIFIMYFVIFGTILAFIGLIGDDSLPGSGFFIWMLLALNFIISIIATISHSKTGKRSNIDELAEKW